MSPRKKASADGPVTPERVVDAAVRVIDEDGLDALTMRRLAHDLGVEPVTVYRQLPNKEAILAAVSERLWREVRPARSAEMPGSEAGTGAGGPEDAGLEAAGLVAAGSATPGAEAAGPGTAGPGTAGPGTAASETAASGTAASGTAGPGTAGSMPAGRELSGPADWRAAIKAMWLGLYAVMRAHPNAIPVIAKGGTYSASAAAGTAGMVALLRDAGLTPDEAAELVHILSACVVGFGFALVFAREIAAGGRPEQPAGPPAAPPPEDLLPYLERMGRWEPAEFATALDIVLAAYGGPDGA